MPKSTKQKRIQYDLFSALKTLETIVRDHPEVTRLVADGVKEVFDRIVKHSKNSNEIDHGKEATKHTSAQTTRLMKMQWFGEKYAPFQEWQKLLEHFWDLLEEYNEPPKEVAYWYGERSLSGLLAAAAWQMETEEGWSLEEFSNPRADENSRSIGRGDLWLGFGEHKGLTIEAKIAWPGSGSEEAYTLVRESLGKANAQLDLVDKEYRTEKRAAVCYVVPMLSADGAYSSPSQIQNLFTNLSERLAKDKICVATFQYVESIPKYNRKLYPGLCVVVQSSSWNKFMSFITTAHFVLDKRDGIGYDGSGA